VQDRGFFCQRLDALTELRGKHTVEDWKSRVMNGDLESVVQELLHSHYDPTYNVSLKRNFAQAEQAPLVVLQDRSADSLRNAAQRLLHS